MKYKFLNMVLAALLLVTSGAHAGIIYNFDLSHVDTNGAGWIEGTLVDTAFSFEFDITTDFNNVQMIDLLAWEVIRGGVTYQISSFAAFNSSKLFSKIDKNIYLTVGGINDAAIWSNPTTEIAAQVGRGQNINLEASGSSLGGTNYLSWGAETRSIKGELQTVSEPPIFAVFAIGIIGLVSRRFKTQS